MKHTFLLSLATLLSLSGSAQLVTFRGENHCGIYPNEKNLLKEWPEGGPEKLDIVSEFRITDGSGACFSHPTIFDGVLYVRRGPALIAYNIRK